MRNITKSYMLKCYTVILMIFSAVRECPADITSVSLDSDMIVLDISKDYSVTRSGISDAIASAKSFFKYDSNTTVVLKFPAGTFHINDDGESGQGLIDVSNIRPAVNERLIFKGKGSSRTTLIFDDSRTDPQLIQTNNSQIAWADAVCLGGRRWRIALKKRHFQPPYSEGDLIGIKSKKGGQAYWFYCGADILFRDVKWTHKTRGVFRGGFNKVRFENCITERAPPINGQTPCLAAPGGGPQIGQPHDLRTDGHVVKSCRFGALGDDAVAFFNAAGEIRDCNISDAFARGILLYKSPDAILTNNTVLRCPVIRNAK